MGERIGLQAMGELAFTGMRYGEQDLYQVDSRGIPGDGAGYI